MFFKVRTGAFVEASLRHLPIRIVVAESSVVLPVHNECLLTCYSVILSWVHSHEVIVDCRILISLIVVCSLEVAFIVTFRLSALKSI